ncbi:hypothetical protein BJX99DRAFT_226016 [Aspergillus californicus]
MDTRCVCYRLSCFKGLIGILFGFVWFGWSWTRWVDRSLVLRLCWTWSGWMG